MSEHWRHLQREQHNNSASILNICLFYNFDVYKFICVIYLYNFNNYTTFTITVRTFLLFVIFKYCHYKIIKMHTFLCEVAPPLRIEIMTVKAETYSKRCTANIIQA